MAPFSEHGYFTNSLFHSQYVRKLLTVLSVNLCCDKDFTTWQAVSGYGCIRFTRLGLLGPNPKPKRSHCVRLRFFVKRLNAYSLQTQ